MGLSSAIEAGSAFVKLVAQDYMSPVFEKVGKSFEAVGSTLTATGGLVAAAGAAILTPLAGATLAFAAAGDQLNKMSARTGFSAEALAALGFAAEQSGANIEVLENGLRKMEQTLAKAARGEGAAGDALKRIGIDAASLADQAPEEQLDAVANGIAGIADPSQRTAAAMEIFGEAGTKLLPLLTGGAEGLRAFKSEAAGLGIVMSTADAQAAADLTDAMNRLRRQTSSLVNEIGAALAPSLTELLAYTQPLIKSVIDWIDHNRQLVVTVAEVGVGLLAAGTAIIGLGTAFAIAGVAFGGLATAWVWGGAALAALGSPIGLVTAGIAAAVVYFVDWQSVLASTTSGLGELWASASEVFGGISSLLLSGDWQGAMDLAVTGLQVAWESGLAAIGSAWTSFKNDWIGTIPELEQGIGDLWDGIVSVWDAGVSIVQSGWAAVVDFFTANTPTISEVFGREIHKFSDIWYGVQENVIKAWGTLERTWIETVGALREAWEASDFKLMFDDMVKSFTEIGEEIKKGWNATVDYVGQRWQEFYSAFTAIVEQLRTVFSSMTSWFNDSFGGEVSHMKGVWTDFLGFFTGVWRNAQKQIGKGFAYVLGGEDAVKAFEEDHERMLKAEAAAAEEGKRRREKERQDELAASKSRQQAALDAIKQRETAGKDQAAIDSYYADANQGVSGMATTPAQQDLAAKLAAAKEKASQQRFNEQLHKLTGPDKKEAEEENPFKAVKRVPSAGQMSTFNAGAARGLGVSSAADRTAKATEKTAENTGKIAAAVADDGDDGGDDDNTFL